MPVREVAVPGYAVDVYQGYDVVSPLSPAVRNMSGLSRAKASFSAASTPSWRTLSEIDSNTGTSTFSLSVVDSNAISPRPRSSQRIQQSNARSQGSEVTFARGVVDNTPRAVDAATAVPKQTVRSWKSLSEIDSNTGSQRSGVTVGRKDVHYTPYLPLYEYYKVLGVRQHPILDAPSTGSSQTRSSQRIQEFNRDLEFIFGRKEAVQEVTSGQEAVDDTPHVAVDTTTAVDTAAAAAVSQQTGDTATKKPKRSRLLRELECTLNMDGYWKSRGPRRTTRIALHF
jgi:hypothetical protein